MIIARKTAPRRISIVSVFMRVWLGWVGLREKDSNGGCCGFVCTQLFKVGGQPVRSRHPLQQFAGFSIHAASLHQFTERKPGPIGVVQCILHKGINVCFGVCHVQGLPDLFTSGPRFTQHERSTRTRIAWRMAWCQGLRVVGKSYGRRYPSESCLEYRRFSFLVNKNLSTLKRFSEHLSCHVYKILLTASPMPHSRHRFPIPKTQIPFPISPLRSRIPLPRFSNPATTHNG